MTWKGKEIGENTWDEGEDGGGKSIETNCV